MAENVEHSRNANLARATVNCRCHVCAFFDNRDDEYSVMLPFMKEGIDGGDRTVYILDKHQRAERLRRLDDASLDTGSIEQSGQLEVPPWENAYLRNGRFDQDAMSCADRGRGENREPTRHRRHAFVGEHGMGAHRLSRRARHCRVRVSFQPRAAELRHDYGLRARPSEIQRVGRDGYSADAPTSHPRWNSAGESILRAARRISARAE